MNSCIGDQPDDEHTADVTYGYSPMGKHTLAYGLLVCLPEFSEEKGVSLVCDEKSGAAWCSSQHGSICLVPSSD